jgi:hypothetical protein
LLIQRCKKLRPMGNLFDHCPVPPDERKICPTNVILRPYSRQRRPYYPSCRPIFPARNRRRADPPPDRGSARPFWAKCGRPRTPKPSPGLRPSRSTNGRRPRACPGSRVEDHSGPPVGHHHRTPAKDVTPGHAPGHKKTARLNRAAKTFFQGNLL